MQTLLSSLTSSTEKFTSYNVNVAPCEEYDGSSYNAFLSVDGQCLIITDNSSVSEEAIRRHPTSNKREVYDIQTEVYNNHHRTGWQKVIKEYELDTYTNVKSPEAVALYKALMLSSSCKSITKTQINEVLKDSGSENIKITGGNYETPKKLTYKNGSGNMVKGIHAASHGPMAVTTAHVTHTLEKFNEVADNLMKLGLTQTKESGTIYFTANAGTKKAIKLWLSELWLPEYAPGVGMDPDYKKIYLCPTFV